MLELETIEALLVVTMAMDATQRFKGGWALRELMTDLGIAPPARKVLADHLVALRKYDALMQDVLDGPAHQRHQFTLVDGFRSLYALLLDALPPTMTCNN